MARINKHDVLIYINKYIKDKYPYYFGLFGDDKEKSSIELMAWVNNIYRELMSIDPDTIVRGNANSEIDELVEEYAKNNFSSDVIDKFDLLHDHINEVIKKNIKYKDNSKILQHIALEIAIHYEGRIDYGKLARGMYDTNIFNRYLDVRVRLYLNEYLKNNYSMDNTGKKQNSSKLIPWVEEIYDKLKSMHINNDMILGGNANDEIDKLFEEIALKEGLSDVYKNNNANNLSISSRDMPNDTLNEKVVDYVKSIIKGMKNSFEIPERVIVSDILMLCAVHKEISASDIINGKKDELIKEYAESKRRNKIPKMTVLVYIYDILKSEANQDISDGKLSNYVVEIYKTLRKKYKFTNKEIMNHECDGIIKNEYNKTIMEEQSVKLETTQNNFGIKFKEPEVIRKILREAVPKFLVASLLGGVLGVAAGVYINRREDNEAVSIVQSIDETDYSINHNYSVLERNDYVEIINGIIDYYNELKSYGDEYVYLCFYNAYDAGLSMTQMDIILAQVRHSVSKVEDSNGLDELVSETRCFYDYMYDSLKEMGCEEIDDSKYLLAILSYKQSYYGNSYGIVSDYHLHEGDRNTLQHMEDLYKEYSRKYRIELGNKINNTETDSFANAGTGRSV